jgi:hypothetical protein
MKFAKVTRSIARVTSSVATGHIPGQPAREMDTLCVTSALRGLDIRDRAAGSPEAACPLPAWDGDQSLALCEAY